MALSNAVALYIRRIKEDESIVPSFNTFYEFVKTDYRKILEEKGVREKDFDLAGFLNVLEPYYRGGEYDFLLNSDKQLDLLGKRFIVFEIDQIKDHPILFPVTTIIIMELFINKMRRLKGVRQDDHHRGSVEGYRQGRDGGLHPLSFQDWSANFTERQLW